jgi:hypothetical protein
MVEVFEGAVVDDEKIRHIHAFPQLLSFFAACYLFLFFLEKFLKSGS